MTPGELADHEKVQPPSMTRVIAVLEERSLVLRSPHPTDRRQVVLTVTEEGRAVVQRVRRAQGRLAGPAAGRADRPRSVPRSGRRADPGEAQPVDITRLPPAASAAASSPARRTGVLGGAQTAADQVQAVRASTAGPGRRPSAATSPVTSAAHPAPGQGQVRLEAAAPVGRRTRPRGWRRPRRIRPAAASACGHRTGRSTARWPGRRPGRRPRPRTRAAPGDAAGRPARAAAPAWPPRPRRPGRGRPG